MALAETIRYIGGVGRQQRERAILRELMTGPDRRYRSDLPFVNRFLVCLALAVVAVALVSPSSRDGGASYPTGDGKTGHSSVSTIPWHDTGIQSGKISQETPGR